MRPIRLNSPNEDPCCVGAGARHSGADREKLAHAAPLAKALYAGGLKSGDHAADEIALDVIAAMRVAVPGAVVGAGTLLRPQDFKRVESAGAQFAVTPGSLRRWRTRPGRRVSAAAGHH